MVIMRALLDFLLDELVRRIAVTSLANIGGKTFAEPLDLDIWIGLPDEQNERVATIYAAKSRRPTRSRRNFIATWPRRERLRAKVFTSPGGLHAVSDMNYAGESRALPFVSFGGIGKRIVAGEILRDAGKRRRARWPAILFRTNNRTG